MRDRFDPEAEAVKLRQSQTGDLFSDAAGSLARETIRNELLELELHGTTEEVRHLAEIIAAILDRVWLGRERR